MATCVVPLSDAQLSEINSTTPVRWEFGTRVERRCLNTDDKRDELSDAITMALCTSQDTECSARMVSSYIDRAVHKININKIVEETLAPLRATIHCNDIGYTIGAPVDVAVRLLSLHIANDAKLTEAVKMSQTFLKSRRPKKSLSPFIFVVLLMLIIVIAIYAAQRVRLIMT